MIKTSRVHLSLLLVLLAFACGACATRGPTVRFVTATPAELKNADDLPEVWYEIQAGDELPIHFLFQGVAEGVNEMPLVLKAKSKFYLVSRKDGHFFFSFDGQSIATDAGRFTIALMPGPPSNKAGLLVYLGKPEDMAATLEAMAKEPPAPAAAAEPAVEAESAEEGKAESTP